MVSLINYKIVNEELQNSGHHVNGGANFGQRKHQHQQQQRRQVVGERESGSGSSSSNGAELDSTSRVMKLNLQQEDATKSNYEATKENKSSIVQINGNSEPQAEVTRMPPTSEGAKFQFVTKVPAASKSISDNSNQGARDEEQQQINGHISEQNQQVALTSRKPIAPKKPALLKSQMKFAPVQFTGPNETSNQGERHDNHELVPYAGLGGCPPDFVVTWRSLKFVIEPKWHEKLSALGPVASLSGRFSSENANQRQDATDQQVAANQQDGSGRVRVVLDRLDGSFRSGELTAILGPSGAGKTTLLDCLTGHRKHGLSGSIKISTPSSLSLASNVGNSHYSESTLTTTTPTSTTADPSHHQLAIFNPQTTSGRNNLKVSIIPQNDHLIGHLTVYETLSYASKMKNCFESQFDHKLNIKRVAQQLGLMTCLTTRINKLSGGQYKRVSIAQELLSSPDILILDEPTSGLDAMTCYQTVQVLRKLTDERQASGMKQIAVILTIHQPNSDVFQQFNHVYVVAQGGKCIYEGPPASIESVINRVGIRLPNSHYNPATMIVEIAAGKFGQEAIQKLNGIQKKQYDYVALDEQNSTGDSAVDCQSSSLSSCSSSNEDDGDPRGDSRAKKTRGGAGAGLINKGFVMEKDDNNNSSNDANNNTDSNNNGDVIVIVNQQPKADGDVDSIGKIKLANSSVNNDTNSADNRRRRRRRVKKRATESQGGVMVPILSLGADSLANQKNQLDTKPADGSGDNPKQEKRVKLNSLKADQKFPFWRHTYLHFHRSWLSIVRDPMLCSMQLALHILVPLMVSLVYGTNVGKPNACPRAGPVDIMAYALEPTDAALQLQEDLRTTLENIGYIFFKLYGIIFAAMTVTVLTFPLDMHVLVKEFRNGWYGLSSYFLGRTLADIPFQLTLPLLAMSLSYYATGQPYSYMQWRFLSITGILILSSLIAQSQGLLFGAILMDKMKAAVFVAPAATTPIILFAGFLVRTQSIPRYLRPLSNLSYLRYAIEACLISRYGFNQCECDPAVFNQTVPELPPIARSMLDYWLSSFKVSANDTIHELGGGNSSSIETTTMAAMAENSPDLFTKLIDSLARANSFGRNITSCEQVVPYPMIDYDLKDSQLVNCFAILIFMLVFTRLLTFFIVCFKVKRKV